jgi:hypothetical protein
MHLLPESSTKTERTIDPCPLESKHQTSIKERSLLEIVGGMAILESVKCSEKLSGFTACEVA